MRDKTAEIGLPSAIGAVLLLGLLFALGGNDDDLDTASGFVFFFGYLARLRQLGTKKPVTH